MSGRLKGQFFMLGALILCVLFFLALPAATTYTAGHTDDMTRLVANLESELPRALNLAMLEDGNPAKLGDFTGFMLSKAGERYIAMESLWVLTVPDQDSPGQVEAYAGNWLGRPVTVTVSIDGSEETMQLNNQESGSVTFYGVGSEFDIGISFGDSSWSGQVARDKTNLYSHLRLSRGQNVVVREIVA